MSDDHGIESLLALDEPAERKLALKSRYVEPYHLRLALQDEDPEVREVVAKHPRLTDELAAEIVHGDDRWLASIVAQRPDLRWDTITHILSHPDLHEHIATHPLLTRTHQHQMLASPEVSENTKSVLKDLLTGDDKNFIDEDPWTEAKYRRGGEREFLEWLESDEAKNLPEESDFDEASGGDIEVLGKGLMDSLDSPFKSDKSKFGSLEKLSLPKCFRAYKNSPHHPAALALKYGINRIVHKDIYESGDQAKIDEFDNDWLRHHQQGGAKNKNGHVTIDHLRQALVDNPKFLAQIAAHQKRLHTYLKKYCKHAIKDIDGVPHIALARGYSRYGNIGPDHDAASYSDVHGRALSFADHDHKKVAHRWVPLPSIWYSFELGYPVSGGNLGPEDEFVVSNHPRVKAMQDDIRRVVPTEHEREVGDGPRRPFEPPKMAWLFGKGGASDDQLREFVATGVAKANGEGLGGANNFTYEMQQLFQKQPTAMSEKVVDELLKLNFRDQMFEHLAKTAPSLTDRQFHIIASRLKELKSRGLPGESAFTTNPHLSADQLHKVLDWSHAPDSGGEASFLLNNPEFYKNWNRSHTDKFLDAWLNGRHHSSGAGVSGFFDHLDEHQWNRILSDPNGRWKRAMKNIALADNIPSNAEATIVDHMLSHPQESQFALVNFVRHSNVNRSPDSIRKLYNSLPKDHEAHKFIHMHKDTPDDVIHDIVASHYNSSEPGAPVVIRRVLGTMRNGGIGEVRGRKLPQSVIDLVKNSPGGAREKGFLASDSANATPDDVVELAKKACTTPMQTQDFIRYSKEAWSKVRSPPLSVEHLQQLKDVFAYGLSIPTTEPEMQEFHETQKKEVLEQLDNMIEFRRWSDSLPKKTAETPGQTIDPAPATNAPQDTLYTDVEPTIPAYVREQVRRHGWRRFHNGNLETSRKVTTQPDGTMLAKNVPLIMYPHFGESTEPHGGAYYPVDFDKYATAINPATTPERLAETKAIHSVSSHPDPQKSLNTRSRFQRLIAQPTYELEDDGVDIGPVARRLPDPSKALQVVLDTSSKANEDHERQHAIFGRIGQKVGYDGRRDVVAATLNGLLPEERDVLSKVFEPYSSQYSVFRQPEEKIATLIGYLQDRQIRNAVHIHNKIYHDEAAQRELQAKAKAVHKRLIQIAANLRPEHLDLQLRSHDQAIADWVTKAKIKKAEELWGDDELPEQLGYRDRQVDVLRAVKFLSGKEPNFEEYRQALIRLDDEIEAALAAVGLPLSEKASVESIIEMEDVQKSDKMDDAFKHIEPLTPTASDVVKDMKVANERKEIVPIKLKGKHSEAVKIIHMESGEDWLLKPEPSSVSPAAGAKGQPASQTRREVAFYYLAKAIGLDCVPRAEGVILDGKECAVVRMLGTDWHNIGRVLELDPSAPRRILTKYLQSGDIYKWSLIDWVAGSPDRHANNIMFSRDWEIALIDHGSAFADESFDPVHDKNSFVPYYIRCWGPHKGWSKLTDEQRIQTVPAAKADVDAKIRKWAMSIDVGLIEKTLSVFGVDYRPTVDRLKKIQTELPIQENASAYLIGLWILS